MTSYRDEETTVAPDERASLLAHQQSQEEAQTSAEDGDLSSKPQDAPTTYWHYAWRGFGIILAILVIAVFVKGWIDADDVNVSQTPPVHVISHD